MSQRLMTRCLIAALLLSSFSSTRAQPVDLTTELTEARRIFVPAEDLDVIVERDKRGAMLSRKKFDELLALAKANAAKAGPNLPIVLTSANYQARIAGDQLLLSVTADLTQFVSDWQALSFAMQRLSVEKATLDDQPAMIGRNQDGSVSLLSDEKGAHVLKLELSTELNSLGSDQVSAFSLLRAPSGTLSLTLPAGKRLLVGALQLERPAPLDQAADYKIAIGGAPGVQLRVTDRAAENAADALTFATTGYGLHVAPGEVTWHALTTLQVFGKPIDKLTFSVPTTLEIADVEASGLEAWDLKDDPNDKQKTIISLSFGQAFDGSRKISFKGVMAIETGKPWTVPALSIANVTSHIGQVVVQHPAGVRLRIEETEGVRRATQGQKPTADMPDEMSKFNATEFLRFDVWQPDFVLRLTTQPKQREVQTAVAAVLDVNATGLDLQALVTVKTQFAPLFELDVRVPADWTILSATRDGAQLKWQVLSQEPGINQLRILLAPPLAAEANATVQLTLRREVEGWPVEVDPITVELPELFLPQSNLSEGTLVVRGDDDLDLAALDLTGLDTVPLKADFERLRFQSQDTRYDGKLKVTRKPSRIAAQTITVSRLDPQTMHAFVQAIVEVQGGGVRTLKVALPESAGTALRFQSPVRQIIEQKPGAVQDGERIWTLQFDQRVRGAVPIFCDIELPRGNEQLFVVPQARFVDAERQNGFQAVEAGGEQRLTIDARNSDGTQLAEVDPLDLPQVYYVPKERVVAVYKNVTAGAKVTLSEERFDKLPVPTAVCPMLDVTSILGRTGELQHRATFALIAVGVQGLRVTLPAGTMLWATLVDGQPVEVRRQGDIYLVPLNTVATAAGNPGNTRQLQLYYRSEVPALTQFGNFEQPPPELAVQTGQGTSQPVDVLDQRWQLHYPNKTLLVDSNGWLEPEQPLDETGLLGRLNTGVRVPTLTELGWQAFAVIITLGVISFFVLVFRKGRSAFVISLVLFLVVSVGFFWVTMPSARYAYAPNSMKQLGMAMHNYDGDIKSETTATPPPMAGAEIADFSDAPAPRTPMAMPMPTEGEKKDMAKDMEEPSDPFSGVAQSITKERSKAQDEVREAFPRIEVAQGQAQQPKAPPQQPAVQPNRTGKDKLALLSLAIDLAPPDGSLRKTFRYTGAEPARGGVKLQLSYIDEQSGTVLRVFLVAFVALLGWFLRGSYCATKATIAALGLTVPLALLPLVPQKLQVVLDGAFFGVLVMCGLWLIVAIVKGAEKCCSTCCRWWSKPNGNRPAPTVTAGLLALLLLGGSAFAQQQAANKDAAPSPPVHRESTLILPFDAGTDPLAADKVLLPFDKFVELYRQAYPDKPMKGTAPTAGGVVDALYSAKIVPNEKTPDESTIEITARYAVRSYVDGQLQVELPLGAVAAKSAKLDGKNAPLIVVGACSKVAISTPGLHIVDFVFSIPARLSGSTGSFALPLLPVPSGKLSLALPAKDLSVRVNGSSTIFRRVTQGDAQSIEVPVDKGGDLTIAWQPEQAKGAAAAVVHVDSVQAITLTDAGIRVSSGFQYRIRQGSVADVTFTLPATYRLQSVNGPDVGGWELQGEGDARKLRVIFRRNITDTTQLTVESFLDIRVGLTATDVEIPQLAPQEVTNEIGQVAVFSGNQFTLRAEKVESLAQIDADKFTTTIPVSRPNVAPQLAYRFSKRPFALTLRATRQESQANVAAQQAAFITLRKQQLTTRFVYNLTGAPRSSFSIALPDGYVVLDVKATGLHDWSIGKQDDVTSLTIDLDGPRLGVAEVVLSGTVPRDNNATSASLVFPRPLDATKMTSTAAVWLDEGYSGTLDTFDGWRSIDSALVNGELKAVRPNQPVQFAFQSSAQTPSPITLNLQRATPKLSANGLAMVSVTDVAVVHTLALQWQIDTATTDFLVFTTPSFLAGKLEFTGNGIRETTHADAGNGRTRWTIWLRTPVSGRYFAAAVGTLPPAATEVVAPSIIFEKATSGAAPAASGSIEAQRQYALLINLSQSQLTSATPELTESVQREDVPVVVDQTLVDQATELVRIKELGTAPRWTLQTFAQQAAAPASVNVADLTTIVARDGTYRGMAIYTIKNRSRQFLALRLPEKAVLMSVFVGDLPSRAVTVKRNNQTMQLIALPKTSAASLAFPVRVIWRGNLSSELPKNARLIDQEVDLPAPVVVSQQDDPDFGIPVARTRWTVYLPDDLDARPLSLSSRHNLTQQTTDQQDLLYEKARVQEISELLGFVESNYSLSSRSEQLRQSQVRNNLKQIGLALHNVRQLEQSVRGISGDEDFNRQRDVALKRLDDLQSSVERDQRSAFEADSVAALTPQINLNGLDGIQIQGTLGNNSQPIVSNSVTLFQSNRGDAAAVAAQNDVTSNGFFFELKTKGESKEETANKKPDAEAKPSGKMAKDATKDDNLQARQSLRRGNEANLDQLNVAINQQKLAGQQGQQGQFGFQQQTQLGAQVQQPGQQGRSGPQPVQYGAFNERHPAYAPGQTIDPNQQFLELPPGTSAGRGGQQGLWMANPVNPQFGGQQGGQGGFAGGQFGGGWRVTGGSQPGNNFNNPNAPLGNNFAPVIVEGFNSPVASPNGNFPPGTSIPLGNSMYNNAQPTARPTTTGIAVDASGMFRAAGPAGAQPQIADGLANEMMIAEAQQQMIVAQAEGGAAGGGLGSPAWTQAGGLSLGFNLPATGKKLVFTKTGGDPKLALAVRPRESIRWGLNLVWTAVWLAIGIAIVLAVRSASVIGRLSYQLPVAVAALSILGFIVLPNPLSACAFVTFVIAALTVAWMNRHEPTKA